MGQPSILYCTYAPEATVTASVTGNSGEDGVLVATEDSFYQPLATTTFNLVIDQGAAVAVDSIAILGHGLNSTNLEVRASTDNFAASDVSIYASTAMVSDVNAAWVSFSVETYRYWKFIFSGHSSDMRVAHICTMQRPILPYFETDPDIDNVTPTVVQLVSQSGIYIGSNQQKAMRKMSLVWGEVTPVESAVITTFAEACIKVVNPFFFVPDIDETDCFFGWVPGGGSFSSPFTTGVHTINPIDFETRAA